MRSQGDRETNHKKETEKPWRQRDKEKIATWPSGGMKEEIGGLYDAGNT